MGRGKAAAGWPVVLPEKEGRPAVAGTGAGAGAGNVAPPGRGIKDERPGINDAT
jgi:hypothetical protein